MNAQTLLHSPSFHQSDRSSLKTNDQFTYPHESSLGLCRARTALLKNEADPSKSHNSRNNRKPAGFAVSAKVDLIIPNLWPYFFRLLSSLVL